MAYDKKVPMINDDELFWTDSFERQCVNIE